MQFLDVPNYVQIRLTFFSLRIKYLLFKITSSNPQHGYDKQNINRQEHAGLYHGWYENHFLSFFFLLFSFYELTHWNPSLSWSTAPIMLSPRLAIWEASTHMTASCVLTCFTRRMKQITRTFQVPQPLAVTNHKAMVIHILHNDIYS